MNELTAGFGDRTEGETEGPEEQDEPLLIQSEPEEDNNNDRREDDVLEPPAWEADEQTSNCHLCQAQFSVIRRRHHCRNCGKIFCGNCSSNKLKLPQYKTNSGRPERVCNSCFAKLSPSLKGGRSPAPNSPTLSPNSGSGLRKSNQDFSLLNTDNTAG
eukprot:TRINITY_DN3700_c0_g1_i2.p1 TRINITY_DN3700_c0_g1~~TRINITY_DN3700_c0_g1_i2.p1  ORF type:complete len:158 (-),score=27.15 TRINITY_DN3700_c0_g1_i2:71-544(-)